MKTKLAAPVSLLWIIIGIFIFSALPAFSQSGAPVIVTQPTGGAYGPGTNVTLTVAAALPPPPAPPLPATPSGTLQLWLRADAGVITNGAGLVTTWQDQSGNENDASQQNPSQEPTFVPSVGALNGMPSVRFNGIQDGIQGSYLFGSGGVPVPDAMTTYCLYSVADNTSAENLLWLIGIPGGTYGADRCDDIVEQGMIFSTWAYAYPTYYGLPTDNYRIWSDEIDTNLDSLYMNDITSNGMNSFSFELTNAYTPENGYYIGGLNPNVGSVGSPRSFNGDIVEFLVFSGSLSDDDNQAIQNYFNQKYFIIASTTTNSLNYQWQFDGTNLIGATDASLTLTGVDPTNDGTYTVVITDSGGSVTSAPAVLNIGLAPTITSQPLNQTVATTSNAVFAVAAAGTTPLYYQWFFDGSLLVNETNTELVITNIQLDNLGYYDVVVSNALGLAVSSNALLASQVPPFILGQPQSQSVTAGSNLTLAVYIEQPEATLPAVTSGSLTAWLKADAGVTTNSSGQVSLWSDSSGNGFSVSQTNPACQPTLVSVPALFKNAAAIRFSGIQDNVNGSWLYGSRTVSVSNAMTTFCLYNAFSVTNSENLLWLIGTPGAYGASRCDDILQSNMLFSTWAYAYGSPIVVTPNTYRIWTDQLNSNLTTLNMFDEFAFNETNYSHSVSGASPPGPGFYVGGLNPAAPSVGTSRCFTGDIVEFLCFKGSLSEGDRIGVLNYLYTKYFNAISPGATTYQWQFDGTNIAGATNSTLSLTNLQAIQAGFYSVIVSNAAGVTVSSNATVAINSAPVVSFSPSNLVVSVGTNVALNPNIFGTLPITFQWQFDGTNISHATNATLVVTNVQITNSGTYTIVAKNTYGSNSASMTLVAQGSVIQARNTTGAGGEPVVIHITLNALGDEGLASFSFDFNPAVFTYIGSTAGSAAEGGTFIVSANNASNGSVGYLAGAPNGTFPAGTNDIVDVTLIAAPSSSATTNLLTFGGSPYPEGVFDGQSQPLPITFLSGTVAVTATPFEGDIYPLPNGDESINIFDWFEAGRIAAGLDSITNGPAFQKADCAPRTTSGDGQITVADWVQVGRYSAGLDPLVAAGGPTTPTTPTNGTPSGPNDAFALSPTTQGGLTNSVAVTVVTRGMESALSFSVGFDPGVMRFVGASSGSGATGATFLQNTNLAGQGEVGFVLGLLPPSTFSAGTKTMVNMTFASSAYTNASLAFGDVPVVRQLVDSNASFLATTFQDTSLAVAGGEPPLTIARAGTNVVLTWPSIATNFTLQSATVLRQWTNVPTTPALVGSNFAVTSSISTNAHYFRLKH